MTASTSKGCIIVTGASRGIGAAISLGLARAGYAVGCARRAGAICISRRWARCYNGACARAGRPTRAACRRHLARLAPPRTSATPG
jgi:NAD(P)-dependent dehydrogenase (short-subunit alcohol dehydrogenase family)